MSKNTILIVEDEAIIAYDLRSKVERLGYEVVGIASTGEEAIELARLHRPALVLMDIQLAGERWTGSLRRNR
jgi:CheY-like chemotaxis protein